MNKFITLVACAAIDEANIVWRSLNGSERLSGSEFQQLPESQRKYWTVDLTKSFSSVEEWDIDILKVNDTPPEGSPLEIRYCGRCARADEIDMNNK